MDALEKERFDAISQMKRQGLPPIDAIKAVRSKFSVGLGDAKQLVMSHPAWAEEAAAAATLHDEIEMALNHLDQNPDTTSESS
jgi:ribosomal protein L7/L12